MSSASRLKMYSALAAAPCAAIGGIPAEAFAAPQPDTVTTAQMNGSTSFVSANAFTAAGLQFQAFLYEYSSRSSSGGLQLADGDRNGPASLMRFFAVDSVAKSISWNAGFDKENRGYGGWQVFISSSSSTNMVGTMEGSGYLGFAVENQDTDTYVAGWVQFDLNRTLGNGENGSFFKILCYEYRAGDENTTILMPATTGGSTPVPGIGGLAGLAMGAAGVRRKRQRKA